MDEDRFFILNRGEITIRFDAQYYSAMESFPGFTKLRSQIRVRGGKRLPKGHYYSESPTGFRYIRLGDMDWNGNLNYSQFKYLDESTYKILKPYEIFENEIMIAIVGATVGKVALLEKEKYGLTEPTILTENCAKLQLKSKAEITTDFLFILMQMDFFQRQVKREYIQTTLPKLGLDRVGSIQVPTHFSYDEQKHFVERYYNAKEARKQKENQAQELLASIDDYLLTELGINLPPEPENTIESRKFRTPYTTVFGDRLDPYYNQDYFYQIKEAVKESDYPAVFIKDTLQGLMIKGYLPKQEEKDGDNKVVQINSINRDGTINLDDLLTAKDVFSLSQKLHQDDILVVITGATIGKIGYWSYEGDYYLGGDIVKFQAEPSKFDPFYVYAYLRSKPSQVEIKRNITGATNGHLAPHDIKHILIPKPPIEKQQEIAEVIKAKTQQAYELQKKALLDFQRAKKEIEQLILNPANNAH